MKTQSKLNKVIENLVKHFPVILVLLFCLIPLSLFRKGLLIGGGDSFMLLDPGALTKYYIYSWNSKFVSAGGLILAIPNLFPLLYFWTFFQSLSVSPETIEKIWMVSLFILPGISMYYLMSQIYNHFWTKVIASVFWMVNLFLVVAGPFQYTIKPILIAMPLMLSFWIKGLHGKGREPFKYSLLIGLSSLIYASSSVNPPAIASIPFILIIYLFFYLVIEKGKFVRSIKFCFFTLLSYFVINFWWIILFVLNFFSEISAVKGSISFTPLGGGYITEYFRLLGSWGWTSGAYNFPYYPFAHFYYKPFLLLATFIITILVFVTLILKPKNKVVGFFGFLTLVGLFFSKGTSYPLGSLYRWMYQNIPGFWIFREPYAKFTPVTVFSFSVLLGIVVEEITQKTKNWQLLIKHKIVLIPHFIPLFVILIFFAVSFPIINGEIVWDYNIGSMRSNYFKIPEYWKEASNWLAGENVNARVLTMPKSGYGMAYNWEYGFSTADSPAIVLFKNPVLRLSVSKTNADYLISKIYDSISLGSPPASFNLLSLLSTKYIVQQNDLDWRYSYPDTLPPAQMKNVLSGQKSLHFVKSFGQLDFYQFDNDAYLPHFYVPKKQIVSNFDKSDLGELFDFANDEKRTAIFLTDDLQGFSKTNSFINADQVIEIKTKSQVVPEQYSLMEEILNISVPYSGNKPGSLMYRLGKIKELIDKKRSGGNLLASLDKNLFYASKRLREMFNYGDSSNYLLQSLLVEFDQSIEKLTILKNENNSNFLKYFKKTEAMIYFVYDEIERGEINVVSKELIENSFGKYFDLLSLLNNNFQENTYFNFDLPQEGKYHLYSKLNSQLTDYGVQYFDKSNQDFVLTAEGEKNQLVNNNKILNYSPNTVYKLSFDYKKTFNNKGSILIKQNETENIFYLSLLPTEDKEKKFVTFFKSPPGNVFNQATLSYSVPVIKNLKIEKISFPSLILTKIDQDNNEIKVPKIEFLKINPTKYLVKVDNADKPFGLVFSENFHPGWKIYYEDFSENPIKNSYEKKFDYFSQDIKEYIGPMRFFDKNFFTTLFQKPIAQDTHLLVNGYANYWQISPNDVENKESYYLLVEFVPQRLFHLGVLISILGLSFAVIYLYTNLFKEKNEKKNK